MLFYIDSILPTFLHSAITVASANVCRFINELMYNDAVTAECILLDILTDYDCSLLLFSPYAAAAMLFIFI